MTVLPQLERELLAAHRRLGDRRRRGGLTWPWRLDAADWNLRRARHAAVLIVLLLVPLAVAGGALMLLGGQAHPVRPGAAGRSRPGVTGGGGVRGNPTQPDARPSGRRGHDALGADGIGGVRFGASPATVRSTVELLLRRQGGAYTRYLGICGVDRSITWSDGRRASVQPSLVAYFGRAKFVGYQYGTYSAANTPHTPLRGIELATTRGLRIDDPLTRGRALYGKAFRLSAAQGGTWSVTVAGRTLTGYAAGRSSHGQVGWHSVVATIDAGDVGCPALAP